MLLFHHQIKISYSRLLIPGELRFSFLIGIGFIPCGLKYLGRPISNSDVCVFHGIFANTTHLKAKFSPCRKAKYFAKGRAWKLQSTKIKRKGKEKKTFYDSSFCLEIRVIYFKSPLANQNKIILRCFYFLNYMFQIKILLFYISIFKFKKDKKSTRK